MRIAYFDCFSGASGDMLLGALVDSGLELPRLEAELRRLPLPDWSITAEKVKKKGIAATHVRVHTHEHHAHRGLSEILRLIEQGHQAGLSARAAERASAIFRRLGEAEAKIHDVPVEKIHFHEVGAVDAIVDIVGASAGFDLLGIDEFYASPLNVGAGRVEAAHGVMPVPAPATAELVKGAPTYSTGIERELLTPTGAAILTTIVQRFGPQPPLKLEAIGYGAGSAELPSQANVLRLFVGESVPQGETPRGFDETISVIEASVDDLNPQVYAYFAERALAAGALDVTSAPLQMKKGRPGQLITVLAPPGRADALTDLFFRETTTIGVRAWEARRRVLAREIVSVETPYGPIPVKVSRMNGRVLNAAPEFEDCRRIALDRGAPLKQVLAAAAAAFQKLAGNDTL
ncbi:MAG TPA: nickel pincer cofactor biosynthesis protein LarC [Candidatus Acidoferrales bacterium]|nr:nickel pincer cofactor biosynthesis protein LarC [Candidatus Acidoferrales bacterium]